MAGQPYRVDSLVDTPLFIFVHCVLRDGSLNAPAATGGIYETTI